MNSTRHFLRDRENIVLLVCDSYETIHIPKDMTEAKHNLALFPVANLALIEYVLRSLVDQDLPNVILAGRSLKPVVEYINSTELPRLLNFHMMECDGKSLGDVMRYMSDKGCEMTSMLVLYANHFTTFDLKEVFARHEQSGDALITLFLHENTSNRQVSHMYGFKDEKVVYYERVLNDEYDNKELLKTLDKHGTMNVSTTLSSPTVAVVSTQVLNVFAEHFDLNNFGDLLSSLLTSDVYNYKVLFCLDRTTGELKDLALDTKASYSNEIVTLWDYFRFNEDVKKGYAINIMECMIPVETVYHHYIEHENSLYLGGLDCVPPLTNTVLGFNSIVSKGCFVSNSFIGSGCSIHSKINNCIVWNGLEVDEDINDEIVFIEDKSVSFFHLEEEMQKQSRAKRTRTFYSDMLDILQPLLDDVGSIDLGSLRKQVSLTRIVWNASEVDLIEAFAQLYFDVLDTDDIEGSAMNISMLFPLLTDLEGDLELQEHLLLHFYGLIQDVANGDRIALNFALVLMSDGLLDPLVFKAFKKAIKRRQA